jgi:hypothetical protein
MLFFEQLMYLFCEEHIQIRCADRQSLVYAVAGVVSSVWHVHTEGKDMLVQTEDEMVAVAARPACMKMPVRIYQQQ